MRQQAPVADARFRRAQPDAGHQRGAHRPPAVPKTPICATHRMGLRAASSPFRRLGERLSTGVRVVDHLAASGCDPIRQRPTRIFIHRRFGGEVVRICRDDERLLRSRAVALPKALRERRLGAAVMAGRRTRASCLGPGSAGQAGEPGRRVPAQFAQSIVSRDGERPKIAASRSTSWVVNPRCLPLRRPSAAHTVELLDQPINSPSFA
jgi:hypothetical protein